MNQILDKFISNIHIQVVLVSCTAIHHKLSQLLHELKFNFMYLYVQDQAGILKLQLSNSIFDLKFGLDKSHHKIFSESFVYICVQKFSFKFISFSDVFCIFTRNQVKLAHEISTVSCKWFMLGQLIQVWKVISKIQNHSSCEKICCIENAEKIAKRIISQNFLFGNFIKDFLYKIHNTNYTKNSFYQEKLDFQTIFCLAFL